MCTRCVKSDLSISNENQAKWFLPRRLTYLRHGAIIVVVMFTYKSANHLCSKTWISHVVHDMPYKSTKREIIYHCFLRKVPLLEFLVFYVRRGNRFEQANERFTRRCEITPMKSQKIHLLLLTVFGVHTYMLQVRSQFFTIRTDP